MDCGAETIPGRGIGAGKDVFEVGNHPLLVRHPAEAQVEDRLPPGVGGVLHHLQRLNSFEDALPSVEWQLARDGYVGSPKASEAVAAAARVGMRHGYTPAEDAQDVQRGVRGAAPG